MNPRLLIAAALAVALTFSAAGEKPRDGARQAPPPVVQQTISVGRGNTVVIPLGIHGVAGGALEFLIRATPRFGRLSAIRSTGLTTASVSYTAPAKGGATQDFFTYAVRSAEGVSAPGAVSLVITDPVVLPGKLVAPIELDFPQVFCDQRSSVELELTNRGGSALEGEVNPPAPWSVEGIRLFKIAAGQRATFKIVFKSDKPGTFDGDLILQGPPHTAIALHATAEVRLSATPPRLELDRQRGSLTRSGVIHLSNYSGEDARIALAAGPRLMMDHSVTVPSHSGVSVPVFADAGEMSAFDEEVKLNAGDWSAKIGVHAPAVGAVLQFVKSEVGFASQGAGGALEGKAVLENPGGQPATVRLEIEPPFELREATATVPAKGRVEIPVRLVRSDAGVHEAKLTASADGQVAKLDLRAEVAGVPRPAPVASGLVENPAAPAQDDEGDRKTGTATTGASGGISFLPGGLNEIPNALQTRVLEIKPDSASIEWKWDLGTPGTLRFEERVLSLSNDDVLQANWVACALENTNSGRPRIAVKGLEPHALHIIRAVSGEGGAPAVRFTVQFFTPEKKPFFDFHWKPALLLTSVVALAALVWRRRKQMKRVGF